MPDRMWEDRAQLLLRRLLIAATIGGCLLVAVTLIVVLIGLSATRQAVGQLEVLARENRAANSRIQDCTDPAGECFRAGQARTAAAVRSITEVTVAANACSLRTRDADKLADCVAARLGRQQR